MSAKVFLSLFLFFLFFLLVWLFDVALFLKWSLVSTFYFLLSDRSVKPNCRFSCLSVSAVSFFKLAHNGLAVWLVADFGARHCQATMKFEASYNLQYLHYLGNKIYRMLCTCNSFYLFFNKYPDTEDQSINFSEPNCINSPVNSFAPFFSLSSIK